MSSEIPGLPWLTSTGGKRPPRFGLARNAEIVTPSLTNEVSPCTTPGSASAAAPCRGASFCGATPESVAAAPRRKVRRDSVLVSHSVHTYHLCADKTSHNGTTKHKDHNVSCRR